MRRSFILFFIFLLVQINVHSQVDMQVVRGTIIDTESGMPIPGANVIQKGTSNGVVTNFDGEFSIQVPVDAVLVFSYLGYAEQEVAVNGRTDFNISLDPETSALDEVVIVSYGTQKGREVTGAIETVEAEDLQDQPVTQITQQLQGKVAGVQINQYSGQPGRGIGFRIRGAASLFASNQPLIVVDGIPIPGSINNINPAEIETFTVLKDASSTALYGSRAANGVILITTKKAKPGESTIQFSSYYGIQAIPQKRMPQLMNAREWAEFQNEYYEDKVRYEGYTGELDPVYQNPERYGKGTDWLDVMTRDAPVINYDLTISKATEKHSSTVIAGYQKQEGVLINTSSELFSLRLNQSFTFDNNRLKVGFNLAPSYRIDYNNRLNTDGLNGIFEDVLESSPLIAPVDEDGTMPLYVNSPGMVNTINPYARLTQIKDEYKTTRILGNAYLDYEFLKGLSLKTNLAVDKGAETRNRFVPSTIKANGVATALSSSVDNYSWTAEANLEYKATLFEDHNIEALVGYSAQRFNQENNSVTGTNFPSDEVPWINAATAISDGGSNTASYSLLSVIGRLNYNYKGKYLISGAIRQDGSSRFGSNRKYGNFPSVSAGWILSEEDFMDNFNAVNLLKVRASYGITGNNNIGNYTFISNTGNFNYVLDDALVSGISISSLGNADLGWERNKQFDVGLDLSLFNNRISFTYDYYSKITDGLIMDRPIPRASGFTTIKSNVGEIEFWGHEFTLKTINLTGEFQWSSSLNLSFNKNQINSLVDPGFLRRNNTTSSDYYRHQEGRSLGEFYGFINLGLYENQEDLDNSAQVAMGNWFSAVGTIKMKDVNGDGVITADDRTFIGNPSPDFTFGFTNNFSYKNFDLGITLTGAVGGKIVNPAKWAYITNMDGARMLLKEVEDRWRSPENPGSGTYPRTMTNTTGIGRQVNTQWVENGTYLTAKNITLGYTLNPENLFLKNLRVYGSVQNAFILTEYSGMNPEINVGGMDPTKGIGVDENAYPVPRTFSIGINATF